MRLLLKIRSISQVFLFGHLLFSSILHHFHHISFGPDRIDGILPALFLVHDCPSFKCLSSCIHAHVWLNRDFQFLENTPPSWSLCSVRWEYLSLGGNNIPEIELIEDFGYFERNSLGILPDLWLWGPRISLISNFMNYFIF